MATHIARALKPGVILAVAGLLAMSLVSARAQEPTDQDGDTLDQGSVAGATSTSTSQPAAGSC